MTIASRVNLKAVLEDGDILEGSNLADLIDSFLHLTDTTAQTVVSPTTFTGSVTMTNLNLDDIDVSALNASRVSTGSILTSGLSATFASILSALSANSVFASSVTVGNVLSANTVYADTIKVSGVMSAQNVFMQDVTITGSLSAQQAFVSSLSCNTINSAATANIDILSALNAIIDNLTVTSTVSAIHVFATSADIVNGNILQARLAGSIMLGSLTFDTVPVTANASAGAGGAVPANVTGFLKVTVSGRDVRIPYFED